MTQGLYCNNCGSLNDLENIFCSECGVYLNKGMVPPTKPEKTRNNKVKHSKSIRKLILICGACLIVLASGASSLVIYHNEQIKNQKKTDLKTALSNHSQKQKSSNLSSYKNLQNLAVTAVDKAYTTKSSEDIYSAQEAVKKLDSEDRSALSERLKNLTDQISKESSEKTTTMSSQEQTAQTPNLKTKYKAAGNSLIFYPNPVGQADGVYRIDTENDDGTVNMGTWRPYKQVGNNIYDSTNGVSISAGDINVGEQNAVFQTTGIFNITIDTQSGNIQIGGETFVPEN